MRVRQYTCKCGISDGETVYFLGAEHLTLQGGGLTREIPYSEIEFVHLAHRPSKHIWNSYWCTIGMRNGESLELSNKSYYGIFKIRDRSKDYVVFMKEFHKVLSSKNRGVIFSAGLSMADYLGLGFGFVFFLALAIILIAYGKHGGMIGSFIPISWLIWIALTFLKNRPGKYDPLNIPSRLLPENRIKNQQLSSMN